MSSATLAVFVVVCLSTASSCSISIVTSCELYRAKFFSCGMIPVANMSILVVPKKKGTATFLMTPNTSRIRGSVISTWSIAMRTTSTFRFVTPRSDGFWLTRIKHIRSGSTKYKRSRFGSTPVSRTQSAECVRDEFSSIAMGTL